jgi:hypothetical protein
MLRVLFLNKKQMTKKKKKKKKHPAGAFSNNKLLPHKDPWVCGASGLVAST